MLLCVGSFCLSASQIAGSDHQPRLQRDQGCGRDLGKEGTTKSALADGLHISEAYGLGLVLPLDSSGLLVTLYCRLEALYDDESQRRIRHP